MRIIAKCNFDINGTAFYNKGDEVKVGSKEQLIKLNERGFIEPLTMKDIQDFGKEEKKPVKIENKKNEKEE